MHTVTDDVFNELKREAINIWQTYDDTHGYATEKISMIEPIKNYADNFGTFVGMFDIKNQRKLYDAVGTAEAKAAIDAWVGGLENAEQQAEEMGLI